CHRTPNHISSKAAITAPISTIRAATLRESILFISDLTISVRKTLGSSPPHGLAARVSARETRATRGFRRQPVPPRADHGLYLRDTQSTPAYEAVSDNKYPCRHRFLLENHADHFYGGARVSQTDYRYGGSPRVQWAGPRLRLNPHRERPCGNDRRSPCVP